MKDPGELALILSRALAELASRPAYSLDAAAARAIAETGAALTSQLASLPEDMRQLLHAGDTGFASAGAWVDKSIQQQDKQISDVTRGATVLASWLGPDGRQAERLFLIRGHIRSWAHRWRTRELGSAQVDADPAFVNFAGECLHRAGLDGDYLSLIADALRKDWRTAAH